MHRRYVLVAMYDGTHALALHAIILDPTRPAPHTPIASLSLRLALSASLSPPKFDGCRKFADSSATLTTACPCAHAGTTHISHGHANHGRSSNEAPHSRLLSPKHVTKSNSQHAVTSNPRARSSTLSRQPSMREPTELRGSTRGVRHIFSAVGCCVAAPQTELQHVCTRR